MLWTSISLLLSGLNIPYFKKLIWEHLITQGGQKARSHPTPVRHPPSPWGQRCGWHSRSPPPHHLSLLSIFSCLIHSLYLFISLSFFLIGLFVFNSLNHFSPPTGNDTSHLHCTRLCYALGGLKALPADGWHPSSGKASFNLRFLKKKVQVSSWHSLFTVPEGTTLSS